MKRMELFRFSTQSWIPSTVRQAITAFVYHVQPSDMTESMSIRPDDLEKDPTHTGNLFDNFHNKDSILNMQPHLREEDIPVQSIRNMSPKQALRMLTHSAWERRPITIVTVSETPLRRFRSVVAAPFYSMYFTLTGRPLPISTLFFTTLFPILPIMATWDLFAEMLGNYSEEELDDLAEHIHVPGYRFKTGRLIEYGRPSCYYLIGYPELRKAA